MSSCWSEEDFFTDALKILETNTTEEINHDTPKLDHNFTNGNVIPTKLDRCSMAFIGPVDRVRVVGHHVVESPFIFVDTFEKIED